MLLERVNLCLFNTVNVNIFLFYKQLNLIVDQGSGLVFLLKYNKKNAPMFFTTFKKAKDGCTKFLTFFFADGQLLIYVAKAVSTSIRYPQILFWLGILSFLSNILLCLPAIPRL